MYPIALLAMALSVLPQADRVPTFGLGESASVRLQGGSAWVRILEQDYVFLRVTADSPVTMTAFDADERILASSQPGQELILSAYSDYWFYIRVEGQAGDRVTISASEAGPSRLAAGAQASGTLSLSRMGDSYRFIPGSRGTWSFQLAGEGGMDLDLEVYGPGMTLWSGSYGAEADETVACAAMPAETLTVVVSRYSKGGTGEYTLRTSRTGSFPVLDRSVVGSLDLSTSVTRFLLPPLREWSLLRLTSAAGEGDIDLHVLALRGSTVASSADYGLDEALLLPPGRDSLIAEVHAYDFGEADNLRFQLGRIGDIPVHAGSLDTLVGVSNETPAVIGLVNTGADALWRLSAVFEKLHDGQLMVFRGTGTAGAVMSSERGDESFVVWAGSGDTLWVYPSFDGVSSASDCRVTASAFNSPVLSARASGSLSPEEPARSYAFTAREGSIVSVRLRGADRETDLDLFISGPGLDRTAQGWISNADAAGDEEVAFFSPSTASYAATVYTYERRGQGAYELSMESIPESGLAAGSAARETWVLVAGISGYPSSADALNRAGMDALDFFRFLRDDQHVPRDHVILLVDGMATAAAFRSGFEDLIDTAGPEDKVVVFFSGHGNQLAPGSGGPEEGDSANETICLYDDEIDDDWIASHVRGAEAPVVLMIDACFSGGLVNDFAPGDNVLVLTAAREDRSVSERILTPILLDGSMGAADSDSDGMVSASELRDLVDARLQLICPVCDAVLEPGAPACPECGSALKGENQVPRPEQGYFLDTDIDLWTVTVD